MATGRWSTYITQSYSDMSHNSISITNVSKSQIWTEASEKCFTFTICFMCECWLEVWGGLDKKKGEMVSKTLFFWHLDLCLIPESCIKVTISITNSEFKEIVKCFPQIHQHTHTHTNCHPLLALIVRFKCLNIQWTGCWSMIRVRIPVSI